MVDTIDQSIEQVHVTKYLSRLLEITVLIVACILAFLPRVITVVRYEPGFFQKY